MYLASLHSLQLSALRLLFLVLTSGLIVALAQNSTSRSLSKLQCPAGFHCFNNTVKTVTIKVGHNGHICNEQDECYGERDPLGFVFGPRQKPQTVIQGDRVIFEPNSITFEPRNVSKNAFDSCAQNGQLVHNKTSASFEVPTKYLNPPGIKYFIGDDTLLSCTFGIKLELYVRSRQQPNCINPAIPNLGVCSGTGLCASNASKFFTRNYSCLCPAAYQGKYCEELDSCDSSRNPCKNGATCQDISDGLYDSFNCTCLPGYDGTFCGRNVNECASSPCKNGGFCVDYINYYKCLCQPDTEGVNCETVILDLCTLQPCANGGTCERSGEKRQNYTCICPPNFTGQNCTVNITSSSVQFSSTLPYQTSILLSTTLLINSSFATQGFSSLLSFTTKELTSSPKPTSQMRTSTFSVSSQRLSSVSMSLQQSVSSIITTNIASASQTTAKLSSLSLKTFDSSVKLISSSTEILSPSVTRSSILIFSGSFSTSIFGQRSSSIVPGTTSSTLAPSLHATSSSSATSSYSSLLPASSPAVTSTVGQASIVTSSYSSLLPASSPAVTSTVGQASIVTSRLPFSSAVVTSLKISTGTLLTFPTTSLSVLSKSTSSRGTAMPSSTTVLYTSTTTLFPSRSTVLVSSSVVPTAPPTPTTPPLRNQTCIHNPCNNGTCFDESYLGNKFRCECPYPTVGPQCISIQEVDLHFPAFRRGSFLEHKSISFNSELNTIDITFQTNASEGLLLFAADHKKRGDFIELRVVGGKLEFRFDPGDSLVFIESNERVDTGKIITATVTYVRTSDPPFGTLQVDNGVQLKRAVQGKLKGIQLYDSWYVGGVPPGLSMLNKTKGNAAPSPSFVGAIRDVQVNGEAINLADATNWFGINEGDMPACQKMPCQNDGLCIPHEDNVHDYSCNCTTGYEGRNCEIHTACESENCNGGECIPRDSNPLEFVCLCPLGRVGVQCETVIDITVPLFTIVQSFPSFLEYPVPVDAVKSFHVTFQFKLDKSSTSWNDSLLVYSAQNKFQGSGDDFFAVGLKNNTVLLQYNLGSGIARIYSEPLDPSQEWHLVVAGRDGRDGYLYVDNQQRKEGQSDGSLIGLNLFEPLYIGGIPDRRQLPSVVDFESGGFHGSIYDVGIRFSLKKPFIQLSTSKSVQDSSKEWAVIRGRNIGNESYDECSSRNPPCANGGNCTREGATFLCSCLENWAGLYCSSPRVPCYGYSNPCVTGSCRPDGSAVKCDCPLGKTGQRCDQDITIQRPLFQNFSYMLFEKTNVRSTTQITIRFKPATLSGILFYVGYNEQSPTGDFLSIFLHNGFVKLRYDLGKGVGEAKSNLTISLGTWYTVTVNRTDELASLSVDSNASVSVVSPGSAVALDVHSNFYLGGVRKLSAINAKAVDNDVQDFSGCIDQFEVNGILYFQSNTGALEGRNIANCPVQSQV